MLNDVIVGNVCSLLAMVTDSISGTRKKRNEILGFQTLSQVFYGVGSTILKGYSSVAQNIAGILRNIAVMKDIKSKVVEWALVAVGVVLGVLFNNRGLLGWLPIVANFEYAVSMFKFKDNEKGLKTAFTLNMTMYSIFNFFIRNYVGGITNMVTAVTTAVSLIKELKGSDKNG